MDYTSLEPKKKKNAAFNSLFFVAILIVGAMGQLEISFSATEGRSSATTDWDDLEYDGPYRQKKDEQILAPTLDIFNFVEKKGHRYFLKAHILKKKREEEDRLKRAEQYVLRTRKAGYYDCPTCYKQYGEMNIFLPKNAILKYGVTVHGKGRYTTEFYKRNNCRYEIQFTGNYFECLLEEKDKIYNYLITKENMRRDTPLISTPWNCNSN